MTLIARITRLFKADLHGILDGLDHGLAQRDRRHFKPARSAPEDSHLYIPYLRDSEGQCGCSHVRRVTQAHAGDGDRWTCR